MADALLSAIDGTLAKVPIDFGGGCSVLKAYIMAWLIRRFHLRTSLDIGVYRGRSLFPQGIAHQFAGDGVAYGVDPYSATEAMEHDHAALREQIKTFLEATDFEELFRQVSQRREEFGLSKQVRLVRTTSARAAEQFAAEGTSFGLIHIDGNHDTAAVMRDVELYLPLLQPKGFLVMDDVSWDSVRPAEEEVASRTRLVLRCVTPDKLNDFAIYRKGGSWLGTTLLSRKLRRLART